MRVLIRTNFAKKNAIDTARAVVKKLCDIEITPLLTKEDSEQLGVFSDVFIDSLDNLLKDCAIIITIGGDGTVLNEVPNAIKADCPILGINGGRVGFLTQLETGELDQLIRIKTGNYKTSSRMMIKGVVKTGFTKKTYFALNDIVLKRLGYEAGLLDIGVYEEDQLMFRQRADGIIFATATGSTAYSLSAGGPVLSPEVDGIILSPICPHNTFRASMVLDSSKSYNVIEEHSYDKWGFSLGVDGNWLCEVEKGQKVIISSSPVRLKLIDFQLRNFYDNLNTKLGYAQTTTK